MRPGFSILESPCLSEEIGRLFKGYSLKQQLPELTVKIVVREVIESHYLTFDFIHPNSEEASISDKILELNRKWSDGILIPKNFDIEYKRYGGNIYLIQDECRNCRRDILLLTSLIDRMQLHDPKELWYDIADIKVYDKTDLNIRTGEPKIKRLNKICEPVTRLRNFAEEQIKKETSLLEKQREQTEKQNAIAEFDENVRWCLDLWRSFSSIYKDFCNLFRLVENVGIRDYTKLCQGTLKPNKYTQAIIETKKATDKILNYTPQLSEFAEHFEKIKQQFAYPSDYGYKICGWYDITEKNWEKYFSKYINPTKYDIDALLLLRGNKNLSEKISSIMEGARRALHDIEEARCSSIN